MNKDDQKLVCRDCRKEFVFTAGEQQFFSSRGFNPPTRCQECRKKKKQGFIKEPEKSAPAGGSYEIKCSKCGKTTNVPFQPRNPEGVLCSACFEAPITAKK